jgi:hypothetical protein
VKGYFVCFQVLHPCDIEFVKSFKSVDDGLKMTATVSTIDVHLSASTVHTVSSVSIPSKMCSSRHDQNNFVYISLYNKLFTIWLLKSKWLNVMTFTIPLLASIWNLPNLCPSSIPTYWQH